MAITARGFDGLASQIGEAEWARISYMEGLANAPSLVVSGGAVSVGAGTRGLSASAFTALVPGVEVVSSAAEAVTATANTGTVNRFDVVVLNVDWSTNATTLAVVRGGASAPALTQTAGVLWQMPLATITVRPGVTAFLASDIAAAKPLPRMTRWAFNADFPTTTVTASSTGIALATVNLVDPGWPYRVEVDAHARVRPNGALASGAANLAAQLNGVQFGVTVSKSFAYGSDTVTLVTTSDVVSSGARTVRVDISPALVPTNNSFEVYSPGSLGTIRQVPA